MTWLRNLWPLTWHETWTITLGVAIAGLLTIGALLVFEWVERRWSE